MKKLQRTLFILFLFVGIGALLGGVMAIINPKDPGGMPNHLLKSSPFADFLIPGLILFIIVGWGSIFSAFTVYKNMKYRGIISGVFSLGLVIFIVVQCIILQTVNILHVIYFFIGLVEVFLSLTIVVREEKYARKILGSFVNKPHKRNLKIIGLLKRWGDL